MPNYAFFMVLIFALRHCLCVEMQTVLIYSVRGGYWTKLCVFVCVIRRYCWREPQTWWRRCMGCLI